MSNQKLINREPGVEYIEYMVPIDVSPRELKMLNLLCRAQLYIAEMPAPSTVEMAEEELILLADIESFLSE